MIVSGCNLGNLAMCEELVGGESLQGPQKSSSFKVLGDVAMCEDLRLVLLSSHIPVFKLEISTFTSSSRFFQ